MSDQRFGTEATGRATVAPRVRWAAVASIVCLLAALVLAAFALVKGDLWRIAVVLLCVAGAIVSAWYALVRRGPVRVLGTTVGLVAVGGLIWVLVTADFHGVLLSLVFVFGWASAATAAYALRRRSRLERLERPEGTELPAPSAVRPDTYVRPSRPVLIMNPRSGGGKVERFNLSAECEARGVNPVILRPGDDLTGLALDAIDGGADVIGMAGGDGSQALVAALAAERGVPYVCIPAGTRNHLALDLGIDRDDVVGALSAFTDGTDAAVDLATVNGRVFVNNASMGIYAKIVQSDAYRDAKMKTAADMLPDLLGPDAEPFDLRFQGPDGAVWPYAHMLLVSNNPYQLDHLMGGGTRPRLDTGRLGIAAARIDGPGAAVAFIGLEAAGRIRSFPGWAEWDSRTFTVDSAGPVEVGIDGEAKRLDPPLVFESKPGILRVRLPPSAQPFGTDKQPALRMSTLASLLTVAAGRA